MTDWPHAPAHRMSSGGTFMITCGTYRKEHYFRDPQRLSLLQDTLLSVAAQTGWRLQAWAVFSNHYHFVVISQADAAPLAKLVKRLHGSTAVAVNRLDGVTGRKVWHNYFETELTYEQSYLARLNYVLTNPVHHGLVLVADQYPWCSAAWFDRTADRAFARSVRAFKTDGVNVMDDFSSPE